MFESLPMNGILWLCGVWSLTVTRSTTHVLRTVCNCWRLREKKQRRGFTPRLVFKFFPGWSSNFIAIANDIIYKVFLSRCRQRVVTKSLESSVLTRFRMLCWFLLLVRFLSLSREISADVCRNEVHTSVRGGIRYVKALAKLLSSCQTIC